MCVSKDIHLYDIDIISHIRSCFLYVKNIAKVCYSEIKEYVRTHVFMCTVCNSDKHSKVTNNKLNSLQLNN